MILSGETTLDDSVFTDIPGRKFIYPCSGTDWNKPLAVFSGRFDEFHFIDIHYQFSRPVVIERPGWTLIPAMTVLDGLAIDSIRHVQCGGHDHRDISPAWLQEVYECQRSGRTIRVTRRRGFGQYALDEIADGSLGVFFHRGDSTGEGGSNTWFLANRKRRHPPLACLFEKIKRKLAYPALIVSDGSNTDISQLRKAAEESSATAEASLAGKKEFEFSSLRWQRVGEIGSARGRRTVVWRVEPVEGLRPSCRST